jgi:hypothetical protein
MISVAATVLFLYICYDIFAKSESEAKSILSVSEDIENDDLEHIQLGANNIENKQLS